MPCPPPSKKAPLCCTRFHELIEELGSEFDTLQQQLARTDQQNTDLRTQVSSYFSPGAEAQPAEVKSSFEAPWNRAPEVAAAPLNVGAPSMLPSSSDSAPKDREDFAPTVSQSDSEPIRMMRNGSKRTPTLNRKELGSVSSGPSPGTISHALSLTRRKEDQLKFIRKSNKSQTFESWSARDKAIFLVDNVPALVILLNAVTIGMSIDIDKGGIFWDVCEATWIVCYFAEFFAKQVLYGVTWYFAGPDKRWNIFDFVCLSLSVLDVVMTHLISFMEPGGGILGMMKMLRLARLARLVRALRFPIFEELKQMVLGVVAGVRVLIWAIVLLFIIIFFIGVMVNNLMAEDGVEEVSTLPRSMLTVFRCYTDGCTATDGAPLQPQLFHKYGALFFFGYILSFMFVTVGIFNLIMAIFIDNVVSRSLKRKLLEIGSNSVETEHKIKAELAPLIAEDAGYIPEDNPYMKKLQHGASDLELMDSLYMDMTDKELAISRTTFDKWLENREFHELLASADIDISCREDLFDVLDVNLSGDLEVSELVSGLMKMRGPITKSDIVAVRLKSNFIVDLLDDFKSMQRELMDKLNRWN